MTAGDSSPPLCPILLFSASLTFFDPTAGAIGPIRSTAMKLVRTLETGRDSLPFTASGPAGDLSREDGEAELLFGSKNARRLLT